MSDASDLILIDNSSAETQVSHHRLSVGRSHLGLKFNALKCETLSIHDDRRKFSFAYTHISLTIDSTVLPVVNATSMFR